ncbi:MAG TPA: 2,3-diphosphoglycerate-dependent phosphoglycerate mutase [Patescibacteria group bacterium]|nr:2,3-diphosphoglycerate-dependent phosphoglycerate mutase [Patescibacteria group bacterium]
MSYLVLVRHGQSTYNEKGIWAGITDVPLTKRGEEEARKAGETIKDINFDYSYTSKLIRAEKTLEIIKQTINQPQLPTTIDNAIRERDYGDLTGKNKWEMKKELGEELFLKYRRSWDFPPPHGESLKDVYNRVVPFYEAEVLPKLKEGKNILISAHGNSLRALVKYLEDIPENEIPKLEIGTGETYVYTIDTSGKVTNKEIRSINENKLHQ